jgi:hypothetical protein
MFQKFSCFNSKKIINYFKLDNKLNEINNRHDTTKNTVPGLDAK